MWSPPSTDKPRRRLAPLALVVVLVLVAATDASASRSWSPRHQLSAGPGFARYDSQPPSAPSGLALTRVTATTLTLSWRPSRDNRGLRGYVVSRDGTFVVATPRTSTILRGIACGRTYLLGVAAVDASGNRSRVVSLSASTSPCPDTLAPTRPENVIQTTATDTAISLFWSPSLDDVGVAGYGLYLNGVPIGSARGTSFVATGLKCGMSYSLAIDSYDSAQNRSAVTSVFASTRACSVVAPVPTSAPSPTACRTGEYAAQYFNNRTRTGAAALSRCEAAIAHDWGSGSPGGVVASDHFSARWSGSFNFVGGNTTFRARADDGMRVWVDGALLIDAWKDQPATDYAATRSLSAGTHSVKVEYYEAFGGAVAQVSWQAAVPTPPPTMPASPPPPPPLIPPPPPPPTGTVKFQGDWEMGNVHQFRPQWDGAQCANTGVPSTATAARGNLFAVRDIVASGAYSARVDLPAANTLSACEALHPRPIGTGHGYPPNEEWYSVSIRLPGNYTVRSWGLSLVQFNFEDIWGSPLALHGHGPDTTAPSEPNQVRLVGQAGLCRPVGTPYPPGPGCEWSSGRGSSIGPWRIIPPQRFVTGVWHDLLVHVVWTPDPSKGLIEGFHRQRGGQWAQTVAPFTGKPTIQWTQGRSIRPSDVTLDKVGAYRAAHPTALSVWYDNFCVATTRAAAESCF